MVPNLKPWMRNIFSIISEKYEVKNTHLVICILQTPIWVFSLSDHLQQIILILFRCLFWRLIFLIRKNLV